MVFLWLCSCGFLAVLLWCFVFRIVVYCSGRVVVFVWRYYGSGVVRVVLLWCLVALLVVYSCGVVLGSWWVIVVVVFVLWCSCVFVVVPCVSYSGVVWCSYCCSGCGYMWECSYCVFLVVVSCDFIVVSCVSSCGTWLWCSCCVPCLLASFPCYVGLLSCFVLRCSYCDIIVVVLLLAALHLFMCFLLWVSGGVFVEVSCCCSLWLYCGGVIVVMFLWHRFWLYYCGAVVSYWGALWCSCGFLLWSCVVSCVPYCGVVVMCCCGFLVVGLCCGVIAGFLYWLSWFIVVCCCLGGFLLLCCVVVSCCSAVRFWLRFRVVISCGGSLCFLLWVLLLWFPSGVVLAVVFLHIL